MAHPSGAAQRMAGGSARAARYSARMAEDGSGSAELSEASAVTVVDPDWLAVRVAADNDAHGKGQKYANILRRTYLDRGVKVAAKMPNQAGWDFNDVLRGQAQ